MFISYPSFAKHVVVASPNPQPDKFSTRPTGVLIFIVSPCLDVHLRKDNPMLQILFSPTHTPCIRLSLRAGIARVVRDSMTQSSSLAMIAVTESSSGKSHLKIG